MQINKFQWEHQQNHNEASKACKYEVPWPQAIREV